jgi:hypothetical protein
LPESSEQYANKDAAIIGWGTVQEGKSLQLHVKMDLT